MQLLTNVDEAEIERMVDVFIHLLGHPSPIDRLEAPAARSAIHRAVSRVIELRTQERPIVMSINDLHWADPALIGLLEHLVTSLSRHPFALITAMRPGSDVAWPPHNERATVVSLEPAAAQPGRNRRARRTAPGRSVCRSEAAHRAVRAKRRQPIVPPRARCARCGRRRHPRAAQLAAGL